MTALNVFFELHQDLEREGPGDDASTLRALSLVPHLPPQPRVLDIGCGPGMHTRAIAREIRGEIVAIDVHRPYLERLEVRAKEENLKSTITTKVMAMEAMEFRADSFDLIWSEGALYLMGFAKALRTCFSLLRRGGSLAATELCWLRDVRPDEPKEFWDEVYPEMSSVAENLALIRRVGWNIVSHFTLTTESWWQHYYGPLRSRVELLSEKYHDNPHALSVLAQEAREIELFEKYSHVYGHQFFVLQRPW